MKSPWFVCYHPQPEAQLRLICFPHGGGGPQIYRAWAEFLSPQIEVIAVNLPGRGRRFRDPLLTQMEQVSQALVQDLLPYVDKPFALFGHSVGALIAYDVARTLAETEMILPLRLIVSAHHAPHQVQSTDPLYGLPDLDLIDTVRQLNWLDPEVLQDPELLNLILPPLRADFQLSETYYLSEATDPLPIPISALAGYQDTSVPVQAMAEWRAYTSQLCSTVPFPGDHFFTQTHTSDVLSYIAQVLHHDLTTQPPSTLMGATDPYPDRCLHDLFKSAARQDPDATALVGLEQQFTFAELDQLTDRLAAYLQHQGVEPDRLVGIYMTTCVEYVIAYLSILKAGGAYIPIEVAYPQELVSKVLAATDPVTVLTLSSLAPSLPTAWLETNRWVCLDSTSVVDDRRWVWQDPSLTLDHLAYCVMTSGTTGAPKGILCPHRGAVNSYYWRYRHTPYQFGDREACNVFFVWEVIRPLLQGYPTYVIPDDVIYDPPKLVDFLAFHQITRVLLTPSLLEQVLQQTDLKLREKLQKLRLVWLNGEVVSMQLRERFQQTLPHVELWNDYSISECHDICTIRLNDIDPHVTPRYAPVGHAMSNVRVHILDDQLNLVRQGQVGEVYVGGDSLARGYLHQPELTAERFVQDPFHADGTRLFRTGDQGRMLPNGQLEIWGRVQFMVKLRGYSVVLGAVETALSTHPAVNAAVVIPENDAVTRQPDYLVAYVVLTDPEAQMDVNRQLKSYLKTQLPHYAIPAYIIALSSLPLHPVSGKLDRRKLPSPETVMQGQATVSSHPAITGSTEQIVAQVWSEVLHVQITDPADNFFDLGGHSLLAIQVCQRLSQIVARPVSVIDVFEYPTVQALARILETPAEVPVVSPSVQAVSTQDPSDIAIIGMACRFPGASTPDEFWMNLQQGLCSIESLSVAKLEQQGIPSSLYSSEGYVRKGAYIKDSDQFDPEFWGLSYREASWMDPQHRLFLECCWEALEQAGYGKRSRQGDAIGVFGGCWLPLYLLHYLRDGMMDPTNPGDAHLTEIGNDKDYLTSRVSYLLNLKGPSVSIQTSCSTSLVAVATAAQALMTGQCRMALAGASSLILPQGGYQYLEGHVNSRDGRVRTFDAKASGSLFGDGVGVVMLKRLADAQADQDPILAVIKGIAVNNDGHDKAGYSAPSVQGQADVVAAALKRAGVPATTISMIEAHGTGTLIGDPIEVRALTSVFQHSGPQVCALGSVKPNIGHSNIAAGMAGLIKTVLSLQHAQIPPTIAFETPNPDIDLDRSPFYINTTLQPWSPSSLPRRAGVSCFGIGGTNSHAILEEAPQLPDPICEYPPRSVHLLPLSARSLGSLEQNRARLVQYLQTHPDADLGNVAYTWQVGREEGPYRQAVVVNRDPQRAVTQLQDATPLDAYTFNRHRLVFLFPGQGSQHIGMGLGLYQTESHFKTYFDQCCECLLTLMDHDLRNALFAARTPEREATLQQPSLLQPALFAVEYALAKTLIAWGLTPTAVLGHSLGEYVAACVAGSLSLDEALKVVVCRARLIEHAPDGAMLSVSLTSEQRHRVLTKHQDLSLAVVNTTQRIVFSGSVAAIERAEQDLNSQGIACRRIQVNRAFHSPMMAEAAHQLVTHLPSLASQPPELPMISNVTGSWISSALDPHYWSQQMVATVQFAQGIHTILEEGPALFVEVGPGTALTSLVTELLHDTDSTVVSTLPHPRHHQPGAEVRTETTAYHQAMAQLWMRGVTIHWESFQDQRPYRRIPLPTYAFEHRRCWVELPHSPTRTSPPAPAHPKTQFAKTQFAKTQLTPDERFYLPSWTRSLPPTGQDPIAPCCWFLFLERTGCHGSLGEQLALQLTALGHDVVRIYKPTALDDMSADLAKLYDSHPAPQRILYLWSLTEPDDLTVTNNPYPWILSVFQTLARQQPSDPLLIWVVTHRTAQLHQEPLAPIQSTLFGPCTVLPQEYPQFQCRILDIEWPNDSPQLCQQLLHECLTPIPDPQPLVALRGRHRWIQTYEPVALPSASRSCSSGTYIITGGLGRIGRHLATHLATTQSTCHLVLTTTREFPEPKYWSMLASTDPHYDTCQHLLQLIDQGAQVQVLSANVARREDIDRVLALTTATAGSITGIFHAAGTADLRYLPEITAEITQREFDSKIAGVFNWHQALQEHRARTGSGPRFVVLFSSLAAILGGYGMVAYAAANRYMDTFVQTVLDTDTRWISINWDDWAFDYTKEQIPIYDKTTAQLALSPADGLEALERILAYPGLTQVLVASHALPPRVQQWLHQQDPSSVVPMMDPLTQHNGSPNGSSPRDPLAQHIQTIYEEVLGQGSIPVEANFFDLGGDSLLAAQVLLKLQRQHPELPHLSIRQVLDHPSVEALTQWLSQAR